MSRMRFDEKAIKEVTEDWVMAFEGGEDHGKWHEWFDLWTEVFNKLYLDIMLTDEAAEQAQDKILLQLLTDCREASLVTQLVGLKKDLADVDLESERYSCEYVELKNGLYIVVVLDQEEDALPIVSSTRDKAIAEELYQKAIKWIKAND